jgi:glycosyltransferase involved in cell wall biosynthesis
MTGDRPVICIVDGSTDVSGAFMAAQREAGLLADSAEFVLLTSNESRIPRDQLAPFARVHRLPLVSLRRSALSAIIYLPALLYCSFLVLRLLRRENCRRLQLNDFHFAHGAVLRFLGYRGRIVTFIRSHPERFGSIGRLWLQLALWSSDELVAVSQSVRRRMPWPERVQVVYDPTPEAPVLGASAEPNFVLMGNYDPRKGHRDAIAAFHKIADKHPTAGLLLYGSHMGLAGQRANLVALQKAANEGPGAGRIEFRDFVAEPTEALRHARAALSFSHSESFSLACQEASAHGIAVIATRSGGPEEIVEDGLTGYLVDVGDIDAMAQRMDDLLFNPALARKLGMAGAELVRARFPSSEYASGIRRTHQL